MKHHISEDLRSYLSDWLHWAENGAPEEDKYWRSFGLCRGVSNILLEKELYNILMKEFPDD